MYIWIGCKLPEAFSQEIRAHCLFLNQQIGLDTVAFSLPQHISLKISFATGRWKEVLDDLSAWLWDQKPFSVRVKKPERAGNILWLPIAENSELEQLHKELDARLESRFGVPQHQFDKAFLFHSTLFMDENTEKLASMHEQLTDYAIEQELPVDTFLLGVSQSGEAGSYRVVKQIRV